MNSLDIKKFSSSEDIFDTQIVENCTYFRYNIEKLEKVTSSNRSVNKHNQ